jgi:hypothetical protein
MPKIDQLRAAALNVLSLLANVPALQAQACVSHGGCSGPTSYSVDYSGPSSAIVPDTQYYTEVASYDGNPYGYTRVADKKECSGADTDKGDFYSQEECAEACRGESKWFAYGRNYDPFDGVSLSNPLGDYEHDRCDGDGCRCFCEVPGSDSCSQTEHKGYDLYKCACPYYLAF